MEKFNFETELEIDKYALDEEWLKQPNLYFHWSQAKTQALAERDDAKRKLDYKKSTLDLAVRKDPKNWGLDKPTESSIASVIVGDKDYQKELKTFQEANHDYNILEDSIRALEQKRSALDNLTKLHISGYYTSGKEPPKEARSRIEQRQHQDQEKALAESPRLKRLQNK